MWRVVHFNADHRPAKTSRVAYPFAVLVSAKGGPLFA